MRDDEKTKKQLERELDQLRRQVAELETTCLQKNQDQEKLLTAEREQRALADALRQTGAALAGTLRRDQVLDRILEQISTVATYDAACIILFDGHAGRVFRWRGYIRFGATDFVTSTIPDIAQIPTIQKIRETQQPLLVPFATAHDKWVSMPGREWVRSYAVAPIIGRGRVIGLLNIDSEIPEFIDETDAKYLHAFADQAAIALENAWLFDQARHEIAKRIRLLKKERNFMSAVLDTMGALVVVLDSQGRVVRFNWACERIVGFLSNEVKGRFFAELFLIPEEIKAVKTIFRELQAGQTLNSHKSCLKTRDGDPRLVEWTNTALRSKSGALEYIICTGLDVSEQQRAKRALVENEKKYRSFTDQLPIGVYRATEEGRVLDANPALATIFGYDTVEGLLNTPSLAFYKDPLRRRKLMVQSKETAGIIETEIKCRTKDGNMIWVRNTGRIIPAEEGGIDYIGGTIEDITERKVTERALRESEERFRHVMSSISDHIYVTETTGSGIPKVVFVSPTVEALTGYPRERIQSSWQFWLSVIVHPKDRVAAGTHMARAMTGHTSEVEYRLVRADGQVIWVRDSVRVETRKLSKILYGVISDITPRKQAEEALATEQERLAVTLRSINDGVIAINTKGRISVANPVGRTHLAAFGTADFGDILTHVGHQPLEEILAGSSRADNSHEIILEGPPQRTFEVVAQQMDTNRSHRGWVLISRDVTERRAVRVRVQQQERLAAVGQLAAGIAHDFNNILTSIIGLAELAGDAPNIPAETQQDVRRIAEQGHRAAHLTRQILDFSRRTISEKHPLNLSSFLKETLKLLERTISEDIHITLEIEPGDYNFKADPTQIHQLLTNLALNAKDAMPAGGVLRFKLYRQTVAPGEPLSYPVFQAGDWLVLSVQDSGVGIAPEDQSRLFEPFFTTKAVGKGTGLGLAQVYGIVKQHEGFIDVESRLGAGATFTLCFPAEPVVKIPEPQPIIRENAPTGSDEVILLVEDDLTVLEVTQSMLRRLGYQVLTATNGYQALDVYERHMDDIRLVLTDITMPEMGGFSLATALRAKNETIKIVAMTGYPINIEPDNLSTQGIAGWLSKPLNIEKVAQEISQALK